MYSTRSNSSGRWPIPRKGTKYVVTPSHDRKNSIPILIVMRDILGYVKTRKELKKIILDKKIEVNGKLVREDNQSLSLFDVLSIKPINKYFRVNYSTNGKLNVDEIKESEAGKKLCKLVNKKILKKGIVQFNMSDGTNILSKEKINVGDSVLINLKDKKVEKVFHARDGAQVLVIKGKHIGSTGDISAIEKDKIFIKNKEREFEIKLNEIIILN